MNAPTTTPATTVSMVVRELWNLLNDVDPPPEEIERLRAMMAKLDSLGGAPHPARRKTARS